MADRVAECRPVPAKVYPATPEAREWVVEPPACDDEPGSHEVLRFSGAGALTRALEYAHRTYGTALFLSR